MKSVLPFLLATCVAALVSGRGNVAAQVPYPAGIPQAQTPPTPIPPAQIPETWLMLKNGSTFSARMLSAGERVKLRVDNGDIEIRASEIALTGYSLQDLAEQQWALLHQQQLDKQIPFLDWCARYHLYDSADTALAQIAEKGQDPPRIAGYQVRLKRLREIHQEQLAAAAQPALQSPLPAPQVPAPPPAMPAHGMPAPIMPPQIATLPATIPSAPVAVPPTLLLPAKPLAPATTTMPATPPSAVQQAAYQPLEISRDQAAVVKEPAITSPNPATLSSAAVEVFTARVQPWVVSRCSGCHDMNSANSFKVERYSKQEAVPRATTLKNLAATTRLVDKNNPPESPLLVMAARAHGTSLTPPVTAGDAAAMAAFREFVMLATGRELPKETKPDPANSSSLQGLPGHVTPGRATFPASAADEPASVNKAAAVLHQTEAGWQAAIERQRAYDLEAQKLKDLEQSSQRANEARGLIAAPLTPALPSASQPEASRQASQAERLIPQKPAPSLPEAAPTIAPASAAIEPSEILRNLPAELPLFDDAMAKATLTQEQANATKLAAPVSPAFPTAAPPSTALQSAPNQLGAGQPPSPAPPAINLKRPRRMFPLPPEDDPPPKAVGTGDTKRR